MLASQVGDKNGSQRIGGDYIASLRTPLSEEDIQSVSQFTTSTKDPGFKLMQENAAAFKKVIGERQFTVNMMNLIYAGEMKSLLENNPTPDWVAIEQKTKPYGAPGEEILLRAKTVHFINAQGWTSYVPAAKEYLQKYGDNVKEEERKMFEDAIKQHSN